MDANDKKGKIRIYLVIIIILSIIIGLNYQFTIREYNEVQVINIQNLDGVNYANLVTRFTDNGNNWTSFWSFTKIAKVTYDPSLNDSKLIVTTSLLGIIQSFGDPCCQNKYLFVSKTDWERMKEHNFTFS